MYYPYQGVGVNRIVSGVMLVLMASWHWCNGLCEMNAEI